MKKIFFLFATSLSLLLILSGCKKSGDDTTPATNDPRNQFTGTWQGLVHDSISGTKDTLTFAVNIQKDINLVEGYLTFHKIVYKLIEKSVTGGFISFSVLYFDPDCPTYDLTFEFSTSSVKNANPGVIFKGIYCERFEMNVAGQVALINPAADLSHVITFARPGHTWTWRVTNFDNSTCTFTYAMGKDFGNGVYKFDISNTCAWQTMPVTGYWYVTPQEWADMRDSVVGHRFTNFRTDAVVGTVYTTVTGQDSVVNTVESLGEFVTIGNQTYTCIRIRTHQFHPPDYSANGLAWFSYQYGLIKFENLDTSAPPTAVHYEELISRNF